MATYGVARSDVAAVYGSQYLNTGYSITKSGLASGTYYLQVRTHSLGDRQRADVRRRIDDAGGAVRRELSAAPVR